MRTLDARILRKLGKDDQKEDEQSRSCCASVWVCMHQQIRTLQTLWRKWMRTLGAKISSSPMGVFQLIYTALGPKRV